MRLPPLPDAWPGGTVRWLLLAALLVGSAVVAPAVGAQPKELTPEGPPAIPVAEIAQRAETVGELLRRTEERLAPSPEVAAVDDRLQAGTRWIGERFDRAVRAVDAGPSPSTLDNLEDSWQTARAELTAWSALLTRRVTGLDRDLQQLTDLQDTWRRTREEAQASQAPGPVLARVDATLSAIAGVRRSVADRRTRALSTQARVAQQAARCDDVLARVARARKEAASRTLAQDGFPVWSPEARTAWSEIASPLREAVADKVVLLEQFGRAQSARIFAQAIVFVMLALVMWLGRVRVARWAEGEPEIRAVAKVFGQPIASALVLTLLLSLWIYPQRPHAVGNLVGLLLVFPSILILRRLVAPALAPGLYALGACFLIDRVRDLSSVVPSFEQDVFLLEMLAGGLVLLWLLRSGRLGRPRAAPAGEWRPGPGALAWLLLAAVVAALIGGALGFMHLARWLARVALTGSYLAMVLYAAVGIGYGLTAFLLRTRPLRLLYTVQRHRGRLQQRIHGGLRWATIAFWGYVMLGVLGIRESLGATAARVLGATFERGSISVSLGDVVAFALTVWAAFLVSAFVRFVLEEDLYPRVGLGRGLPYALSSLLHYAIVLVGLVVAMAAMGLDLNRITLLAGAFGVGIGIGLQGVVANFVAGLILLVEQHIHVGDIVQVGDLTGEVRRIGIRSSTIRTERGADVLVPNGDLTSARVSNWTLSDRMRRVEVSVGVAYGSDPPRVLELLREVARAHPRVLARPEPVAVCLGFGDSALDVQLQAWSRIEEWELVRSELTVALHAALGAAGIEIPFPRRDIRIRGAEGEPPERVGGHGSRSEGRG